MAAECCCQLSDSLVHPLSILQSLKPASSDQRKRHLMAPLRAYILSIEKALSRGNATEHTYRPFLKNLVESLADGITATNEPRREACGAPDFIITRNKLRVGYIETKDIGKPLSSGKGAILYRRRRSAGVLARACSISSIFIAHWLIHGTCLTIPRKNRDQLPSMTGN